MANKFIQVHDQNTGEFYEVRLIDNADGTYSLAVMLNASLPAGDNNIGNVDVVTLPAGNLGQRAMAASLSTVPASDITDGTYIGDIKFGESLPAGTNNIGQITVAESGLAIAKGLVSGHSAVLKFGNVPDFDTGDGAVYMWDGADDGGADLMQYTYSATADIDSLSSSDDGDTQDIEVYGLDTNYDLVTQTITLTGQTRKALDTALVRVFRMVNVGATDLAGTLYCYVNGAITLGVPDVLTTVRAIITIGNNQTAMALYTVPNGKTAYMGDWYAGVSGASKSSNYEITLYARPFGQVWQLKHIAAISDTGASSIQHQYSSPLVFAAKTDIRMRVNVLATGVSAAACSGGFDLVLVDD